MNKFLRLCGLFVLVSLQTGVLSGRQAEMEPDGKALVGASLIGNSIKITSMIICRGINPVLIGSGNSKFTIYGPHEKVLSSGKIHLPNYDVFEWTDDAGDLHGFTEPFAGHLTITLPYYEQAKSLELRRSGRRLLKCNFEDLPPARLSDLSPVNGSQLSSAPDFHGFARELMQQGEHPRKEEKSISDKADSAASAKVRITGSITIKGIQDYARVSVLIYFAPLKIDGVYTKIEIENESSFKVRLKTGKYLIKAFCMYRDPEADDKEVILYPYPIIISEFDTSEGSIDFFWKKNILFRGQLVNKEGVPVRGEVLMLERNQNFESLRRYYMFAFLETDEEGKFAIRLPAKRFPMLFMPYTYEPAGEVLKIVKVKKKNKVRKFKCPEIKEIMKPALNKIWDSGLKEEKLNIVFLSEAYTDGMESFEDKNNNGVWDGDLVLDENGNGELDEEEYYYDRNWNGIFEESEPFTDENGDGVCNRFERARFEIECALDTALMFNYVPFDRYDDVINVYTYWIASQHGVQRFTQAIPWQNMQTAFGVYCDQTGGAQVPRESADIKAYVSQYVLPEARETIPIVMLRDPFCLSISNARLDFGRIIQSAEDYHCVLIHELGHSIGNLHDEYLFERYPWMPPSTVYTGDEPDRANVTIETDPAKVKWRKFFTGIPPSPTPQYSDGYGLFEGAGLYNKGIFRPTGISMMRNMDAPFFAVNSEQLAKVLSRFR